MNTIKSVLEVRQVAPLPGGVAATDKGRRHPFAVLVVPACAAFFWGALSLPAFGQASAALVGGITRDSSSGKPVAEVQVTAHNLNNRTHRVTVSNTDGAFTFTNLEPGPYEFEAIKTGIPEVFRAGPSRCPPGSPLGSSTATRLRLAPNSGEIERPDTNRAGKGNVGAH